MRRFRSRPMGRRSGRIITQSFKKVINEAPVSIGAAANNVLDISLGVDNVTVGQTSAVDTNVPTGSIIEFITIQFAVQNLVNVAAFAHLAIEQIQSGQGNVSPNAVGGNPLRNQIFHQELFCVGMNQNVNRTIRFKVPKPYQRVREGTKWKLIVQCDQISTQAAQFIYKFKR